MSGPKPLASADKVVLPPGAGTTDGFALTELIVGAAIPPVAVKLFPLEGRYATLIDAGDMVYPLLVALTV
jgi:hypothetical protein